MAAPDDDKNKLKRRSLLALGGAGATGLLLATAASSQGSKYVAPEPFDTGTVTDGKVSFPAWRGPADRQNTPPPAPMDPKERVGFAIIGLGKLALEELLPAFAECRKARVTALISGSPDKLRATARQYGIDPFACHDYASYELLRDNPNVRAVYIALPNAMHREYTERAAAIGRHVLCEKPLAHTAADARAMVASCNRANVRLMTAYRIQYQPHNMRVRQYIQEKTFGRLVAMSCTNVQSAGVVPQWRSKKSMAGGGALIDVGIYCLNTARYLSGEEPTEVMAWMRSPAGDARFAEVEASMNFMLKFPSGLVVNCTTSYDAREDKTQKLNFVNATLDMPDAYSYRGQKLMIGQRQGDDTGYTDLQIPARNQFAAEIDHMAECILENKPPRTPGEEGLRDMVLIEALYKSATTGQPVKIGPAAA